jgi:uncharacterized protein (DUF1810 family)
VRHLRPGGTRHPAAGHDGVGNRSGRIDDWRGPRVDPLADPFALERFVAAQDAHPYSKILRELRACHKTGHWIWFVFPQIAGLGLSARNVRYSIKSLDEARAYLAHDTLGPRLRECVALLLACPIEDIARILEPPDDRKLRSSMTLFLRAAPDEPLFQQVLDRFFGGVPDSRTDSALSL